MKFRRRPTRRATIIASVAIAILAPVCVIIFASNSESLHHAVFASKCKDLHGHVSPQVSTMCVDDEGQLIGFEQ